MNLVGHNFIAKKVLGRYNSLIAAGCHLPDMVPFLKDSILTFDEIHENPEIVYNYLKVNDKSKIDLSLGLMTHSVKFGADRFNKDIEAWLLGNDEDLKFKIADRIARATHIDMETALGPRMHNYLWCGFDFYILDKYPDFVNELNTAYKGIDIPEISQLLSIIFKKPLVDIQKNLEKHIGIVIKHQIVRKEDFISFWKNFTSELPDNDTIDIIETIEEVNFIEDRFYKQWERICNKVSGAITIRMENYL